ncbi:MAG: nucleoside/nucleotide kinase family protein [Micrococcales bacterium]|nr:nucleoside/nucleotide kinase family protein [Micrococcales bacterium]
MTDHLDALADPPTALDALAERAVRLVGQVDHHPRHGEDAPRAVLGIAGPPGSGKSTLAEHLAAAVAARGVPVVRVPMDGFHLADDELVRLGRRDRKGAIDTFDVDGYAALLRRARTEHTRTVYAPNFDRSVHQPVAGSIPVLPDVRLVITEGNYLLCPDPAWRAVRALLGEVWYCELASDERTRRLVARHERFGKPPEAARAWVAGVDQPNATAIAAWRGDADLIVDMLALGLPPGRD